MIYLNFYHCNATEIFRVQEGLDPKELDKKTMAMGFPVGSATLLDEVGIDVGAHIIDYLSVALGTKLGIKKEDGSFFKEMVANGYLGQWYFLGLFYLFIFIYKNH